MTTGTENQGKSMVERIKERLEMVSKGSCKECRFCRVIDWEENEDFDGIPGTKADRYCAIQGNVNPIQFSEKSLDSAAYPSRCDEGCWEETRDCFAYQPRPIGWVSEPSSEWVSLRLHWEYLKSLDDAQKLENSIELVHSGVAESRLRKMLYWLSRVDAHRESKAQDTHIGFITANKPESKTITVRWGVCPECWKEGTISSGVWLNVYKDHFCYCEKHLVWWCIGANLFGSWRGEMREKWDKNKALIEQGKEVEPMHIKPFALNITIELEPN